MRGGSRSLAPWTTLGVSPAPTSAPASGAAHHVPGRGRASRPYGTTRAPSASRLRRGGACSGITRSDLRQVTITVTYRPMTGVGVAGRSRRRPPSRHSSPSDDHASTSCGRPVRRAPFGQRARRGAAHGALEPRDPVRPHRRLLWCSSAIEPTIANNQLAVAQARALAEAGVERALWALSNPPTRRASRLVHDAPRRTTAASSCPSRRAAHAVGGFRVTVTNGPRPYERRISAWASCRTTPRPAAGAPEESRSPRSTLSSSSRTRRRPSPCAGSSGRAATCGWTRAPIGSCGPKVGTLARGETSLAGASADIRGAGGDGTAQATG